MKNQKFEIAVAQSNIDWTGRSGNFFTNLGDTLIYNDFDLNVTITAKAVPQTALA